MFKIKLFLTDVDGVLTDGSMYYTESGDEFKRFHTHDGMAFEMLRNAAGNSGLRNTQIVARRAAKIKADYLFQGKRNSENCPLPSKFVLKWVSHWPK